MSTNGFQIITHYTRSSTDAHSSLANVNREKATPQQPRICIYLASIQTGQSLMLPGECGQPLAIRNKVVVIKR